MRQQEHRTSQREKMKPFTCVVIYELGGQALPLSTLTSALRLCPPAPAHCGGPRGSDRCCVILGAPLPSLGLCQRGVDRWARGKVLVQTGFPRPLPAPTPAWPGPWPLGTGQPAAGRGWTPYPDGPVPQPQAILLFYCTHAASETPTNVVFSKLQRGGRTMAPILASRHPECTASII